MRRGNLVGDPAEGQEWDEVDRLFPRRLILEHRAAPHGARAT